MPPFLKSLVARRQPAFSLRALSLAAVGSGAGVATLGFAESLSDLALLAPAFGATCVLMFAAAKSPMATPSAVIGGHFVSAALGVLLIQILPNAWWTAALGVGLAVAAMIQFRVLHPPAAGQPLLVLLLDPGFDFLLFPVLAGSVALVAFAMAFHAVTGGSYPVEDELPPPRIR